jgi:halogenation protein CepH
MFKSKLIKQVMREGAQVQVRAMLGKNAGQEAPMFPGGLVSSMDGLSWEPSPSA